VSVKAGPSEVAEFGLREVMVGAGAAIVNGNPLVVVLPESTVTVTVLAVAIRVVETGAVSCVALINVVVNAVVFQRTTAPDVKPVPFTVSVNAGPPAVAEFGLREVIVGAAAIVNGNPLVVLLPESTVTETLPTAAIRLAETEAVSWLALTKVVARDVVFQRTTALDAKPLPFTVRVNAGPPAVAEFGLREVIAGDWQSDFPAKNTNATVRASAGLKRRPVIVTASATTEGRYLHRGAI
jgi:hypothetical protein